MLLKNNIRTILKKSNRVSKNMWLGILVSSMVLTAGCAQSETKITDTSVPDDIESATTAANVFETADKATNATESSTGTTSVDETEGSETPADVSSTEATDEKNNSYSEYDGRIYLGKAFQNCGVSYGLSRLFNLDWDTGEGNIICTDPTCKHGVYDAEKNPDPDCSAIMLTEMSLFVPSIVYDGKRIIFETSMITQDTEDGMEARYVTDVLSSDEDGSNRQKITTIPGGVYFATGAIYKDMLYYSSFNGTIWKNDGEFVSEDGIPGVKKVQTDDYSLCCMDLDDFSVKEYIHSDQCFTDFCFTSGYMYCISLGGNKGQCVLKVHLDNGECEKVYEEEKLIGIGGCIGERPLVVLEEEKNKYSICFLDGDKTTKFAQGYKAIIASWGDKVAVCTYWAGNSEADGSGNKTEYTVYDSNGNQIDKVGFDKYVNVLFTVGDKLIYDVSSPDDDMSGKYCISVSDFDKCCTDGIQLIFSE